MTSSGTRTRDRAGSIPPGVLRRSRARATEFVIEREQRFDRPLDEVFAFSSDPRYLPLMIPDWIRFGMIDPREVRMARGTRIDYAVRLHGIPFRWQSEISAWEPPHRFVDEQRRGPFRWWVHTHTFEESEPGQTLVRDVVRYGVPGGRWVDRLIVAPDLERIFAHRRRRLAEIFADGAPRPAPQK